MPNPKLVRNSNLAPAPKKSLETKTLRKIGYESQCFNDNYRFLISLIDKGQVILGQIPDKPLLSIKKLLNQPQKEVSKLAKLIKDAQARSKREQLALENQFQSGQDLYADYMN